MKRFMVLLAVIVTTFTLSGCDMINAAIGGEETGLYYAYFNTEDNSISISYNFDSDEYLSHDYLIIEGRDINTNEWFVIMDRVDPVNEGFEFHYVFPGDGTYEIRIASMNNDGSFVEELGAVLIDVTVGNAVEDFDVNYDEWQHLIWTHMMTYIPNVSYIKVYQESQDGTVSEYLGDIYPRYEQDGMMYVDGGVNAISEGQYIIKYEFFDKDDFYITEFIDENRQVYIDFPSYQATTNFNFHNVESHYDMYEKVINVMWDYEGYPDYFVVEVSTDQENWTEVVQTMNFDHGHKYQEDVEGTYFYRVIAYKDGEAVATRTSSQGVYFDPDTVIYHTDLNCDDYEKMVHFNFDYDRSDYTHTVEYKVDNGEYVEAPYMDQSYVELRNATPGMYTFKLTIFDDTGNVADERIVTKELTLPNPIRHVDVNPDGNYSIRVNTELGNSSSIVYAIYEKSNDNGETWVEIGKGIKRDQDEHIEFLYYEFEQGYYLYRVTGYDAEDNIVGQRVSEIPEYVAVGSYTYYGTPYIHHFNANFNFWDKRVNFDWNVDGDFDEYIIFKSTDLENWEVVQRIPRFAEYYSTTEYDSGTYYYKMQIFKDGVMIQQADTIDQIEVTMEGYIHNMHFDYEEYNSILRINFEIHNDGFDYGGLRVEKSYEGSEYELLFETPNWETEFEISNLEVGTYYFKLYIKDNYGNVQQEKEIIYEVKPPEQIRYIEMWNNDPWEFIIRTFMLENHTLSNVEFYISKDYGEYELLASKDVESTYTVVSTKTYIPEEGNYTFKVVGYDQNGVAVSEEVYHYGELDFSNQTFNGTPDIYEFWTNFDAEGAIVHMNFASNGSFDHYIIEKTTDLGLTWTEVVTAPRVATRYSYYEDNGVYNYRVRAIDADGNVVDTYNYSESVTVNNNMVFTYLDVHSTQEGTSVYWDRNYRHEIGAIKVFTKIEGSNGYGSPYVVDDVSINQFMGLNVANGLYTVKVVAYDTDGVELDSIESGSVYLYEKSVIYEFTVNHRQDYAEMYFDVQAKLDVDVSYNISYTTDSGLTWHVYQYGELGYVLNEYSYIDIATYDMLPEGTYYFKVELFDVNGNLLDTATSVEMYLSHGYSEHGYPVAINSVTARYDIHEKLVRIDMWGQGDFDKLRIEKSTDGMNWTYVEEIHYTAYKFKYSEPVDGNYYYRVSAIDADGTVLSSKETDNTIRVNKDAVIEIFNVGEYMGNIEIYWQLLTVDVGSLTIQRKLITDTEFTDLSTFGPLKTHDLDSVPPGTYIYKLIVRDTFGSIIDEMESNVLEVIETP